MLYPPELRGHCLGRYERSYQSRQLPGKPDKIVSKLLGKSERRENSTNLTDSELP